LFCSSSFIPSISILLSSIAFYDLLETDIDLNIAIAVNPILTPKKQINLLRLGKGKREKEKGKRSGKEKK
jgi:hypothetical protein